MAEKVTEKPATKNEPTPRAESPTTAHQLDFEDDAHDNPSAQPEAEQARQKPRVSFKEQEEETPPPKPPRPMSPQAQAEATLIEAFPSMDTKVIKAVLVASGGRVEPAFNALLGMSDPNFQEEQPPPQPPRKTPAERQMESDELYARQLAQHYQSSRGSEGYGSRERGEPPVPRQRKESGLKPNELYDDREHSFFDDDLPEIKENIRKGFLETQTKVNKWITDFRKKIDGEDDDGDLIRPEQQAQYQANPQSQAHYNSLRGAELRRQSGDRDRYDADPRVLGDDFTALELRDEEAQPHNRSGRPQANPDLFKPTPVAPQSGPVDEVEAALRQSDPSSKSATTGNGGKNKKWQPLTSVAPNPEDDHDPFSLGDSDDEEAKTKDIKADDTERLKKAAAGSPVRTTAGEGVKPAERSGSMSTRNKEAEELLAGKETKS